MIEKRLIEQAHKANIAEYLLSVGVPLAKNGQRYRHKEHESLVFTGNVYCWNSKGQETGDGIDYLKRHMGMSFADAVGALANINALSVNEKSINHFSFSPEMMYDNQDKVKRYLDKIRCVGFCVVDYLLKNGLLFQEKRTNNAYFPMYDENNNCVGAELQGITEKRFKGIKGGSKYGYGFNIRFSHDNTFDYALFFESAIDLISFWDYKVYHEKKSLDRCILVSMAGLKTNIIKHTLTAFEGKLNTVLCVDNDDAGQAFIKTVADEGIKFSTRLPIETVKDWNEQLVLLRKGGRPITRLLKQARS